LDELSLPVGGFSRIGIASFGPLGLRPERETWGHILQTPKPGWSGTEVAGRLSRRFSVPAIIETDVNAAALGEGRRGASRGAMSHVYVTVGTGVGVGVVIEGRPVHGALHPEAGHIRVRRIEGDSYVGRCPWHKDCLEGLISGPALAHQMDGDPEDLPDDHPLLERVGHYLGEALAGIALVASPERIVVGGGVGRRRRVLETARRRFADTTAGYIADTGEDGGPLIVGPMLGGDSGLVGALVLAES